MSRKMPPSDYAMATNWIWDALRDLEAASGFRGLGVPLRVRFRVWGLGFVRGFKGFL